MTQQDIDELQKMYDELTDPVKLEEARRKHKIEQMKESKKKDIGVC